MHRAVADVARFILHAAAENLLVNMGGREKLTLPEHRQDKALTQEMQPPRLCGKRRRVKDSLQTKLAQRARLAEAAAVGQRVCERRQYAAPHPSPASPGI